MSGYFDFLKIQYDLGNLTKNKLKVAVTKNYIIAAEYQQITGETYMQA